MHILYTVLYALLICAGKENLFNNQEVLQLIIISFILMTLMLIQGWFWKEKLDASHSQGLKC